MSAETNQAPLTALTDADLGLFRVWTESSLYVLTLTQHGHTIARTPGEGLGAAPGIPGELAPPSNMRVDGDFLKLVTIERCVVGQSAIFMVAMPPGVPVAPGYLGVTQRTTTIVRGIERLASHRLRRCDR